MDSLNHLQSRFQKNEPSKRRSSNSDLSSKKRHVEKSLQPEQEKAKSNSESKNLSRQLTNHNRNEKERKAKLNRLILTLKEMVPDCGEKEAKNSILEKTCNYLAELRVVNQRYQRLLQGHYSEVHAEEMRLKNQKIKELQEQAECNFEKFKTIRSNTFEHWSNKAKSLTNKLRNQSIENYSKKCNLKSTNRRSENVDILKSAVMETLPMTPSSLEVAEPVQTTPDSTTNCVTDASNTTTAVSVSCVVSTSEITPVTVSTLPCVVPTSNQTTSGSQKILSDPSIGQKFVNQKKKSPTKSEQNDHAGLTATTIANSSNGNLVNSHIPILSHEQALTTSSASVNISSSNSVSVVSHSIMSNVQTVNSGYCSNGYCPPNATGLVSTNNPVIPGIIQSPISGQNVGCLPTSMFQPQSNTVIFGQPPGVLIGQQMVGNQYTVFNQQPFFTNSSQLFPQLNQQITPTVQPFVQGLSGANQSVVPTVGPIGQNLVQVDNKNQFSNCTAILLANGQLLPIVTQPSVISSSATPQDVGPASNVISSDSTQSSKALFLQPCASANQTVNQTAIREPTSTVTTANAPVASQQPNLVSSAKAKRPQRVIKPKPSVTDLNTPSSYTITSQELALSCQMEKLEENDILAKAAESIFSSISEDIVHENESDIENNSGNKSKDVSIIADLSRKSSSEVGVENILKKQGEKRKSETDAEISKVKQLKTAEDWPVTEEIPLNSGRDIENGANKSDEDGQLKQNLCSTSKVATPSKSLAASVSSKPVSSNFHSYPTSKISGCISNKRSLEDNKTTSTAVSDLKIDAKLKSPNLPVKMPSDITKIPTDRISSLTNSINVGPSTNNTESKSSTTGNKITEAKCNKTIPPESFQDSPNTSNENPSKFNSDKKEKSMSKFDALLAGISPSELAKNKCHTSVSFTAPQPDALKESSKIVSDENKQPISISISKKLSESIKEPIATSCNANLVSSANKTQSTNTNDELMEGSVVNLNKLPCQTSSNKIVTSPCLTFTTATETISEKSSTVVTVSNELTHFNSSCTVVSPSTTANCCAINSTIASSAAITTYCNVFSTGFTSSTTNSTLGTVMASSNTTYSTTNSTLMSSLVLSSHTNIQNKIVSKSSIQTLHDKKRNSAPKSPVTTPTVSKEKDSINAFNKATQKFPSGKSTEHTEIAKVQSSVQSSDIHFSTPLSTTPISDNQSTVVVPVTNSTSGFHHANNKNYYNETHPSQISRNTFKSKPQPFNSQNQTNKSCKEPNRPNIASDHNLPIMCPPTHPPIATAIPKTKTLEMSNTLALKSPQSLNNSDIDSNKAVGNMLVNIPYAMLHASPNPNDETVQISQPLAAETPTKSKETVSTSTFSTTSSHHDKNVIISTAPICVTISSSSDSVVKQTAPQLSEQFSALACQPPTNTESTLDVAFNQVARSSTYSSASCSFTSGTQSTMTTTSSFLVPPTSTTHNDVSTTVPQTSSSAFLSISQLTNPPCSLSLNELLTSPTMSDIPSAVVNVNNDSNSANSPFSSIANYFSSSPDPHLPIQSSRMFCESGRSATSVAPFSASELVNNPSSVNKNSNTVCNQDFNSNISQQQVIDNNFEKQEANVFTPFEQSIDNVPTRPSVASMPSNIHQSCVNSTSQMPQTNQISNADVNNQNLISQRNQSTVTSHDRNLKTSDQLTYLNNFCTVDAPHNNGANSINNQNNSSVSPMVNFHNNVSHPVPNMNHSVSPGKQGMNSSVQSHSSNKIHGNTSVSQGKNQNTLNKNQHIKENMHSGSTPLNYGPIWQPSGDLQNTQNFQQQIMPQIIPNMKQNKQVSNKDCSGFPCRNWGHEDELFINSIGYQINQSRSPSNYRASSVSLPSPRSSVSPSTTQSTTVRQSPISDINKINQSPKPTSNVYPSPVGSVQDQNRTYSSQSQKSNFCFNSGYHRGSNSSLSSTYSAEALIGDSSRSCNQNLQTTQPFSSATKVIPHSAESLLPTTSVSNINTSVPPSTFNFQSINPVVSSHSNTSNHFSPGLGLIPRPRFPGFPVPGHNGNHVMNPVGSRSTNIPVEDGISFRWPPPRLPPPISVATSYQSNALRMNTPIANKSPHMNSQNKTRTQKSSSQSLPVTSNQYQFQSYSNPSNQPVTVSNTSSSSKSRSSRNTANKNKAKNSSSSKKTKQSASHSNNFQSSSSLEEINLSGSIFEPNRSITPYFGLSNFSPPRSDTPTYLPNNIMNASHRSQEHNSSTVSTSICNTFASPLFPPRCQSNLNLNFQQSSGSFGVNTIHHHAVPNQMSIPTSSSSNSITSQFNVSNLIPDINNSSPSIPPSNLGPIKFHHGNHIVSSGSQHSSESLSQNQSGSSTPHMYSSRTHPPLLHNGMSINSILSSVPNNMHNNNVCSGGSAYDSRQANNHMQIGPMAPPLVHPPPGHSGSFNNVLSTLNYSVDDH